MKRVPLAVVIVLCIIVTGCTSQAQRRFREYEPVARSCVSDLEKLKSFTQSDVGEPKWNTALADVNASVSKLKDGFSDESSLASYRGILEAARIYGGARSNADLAANPTDDRNGESQGEAYVRNAERDNALPLGAFKTAQASAALNAEADK